MPFAAMTAHSAYDSMVASAGVGLGRLFKLGEASTFTPSVRADYAWVRDQGYTETGAGVLNLVVNSRTTDQLILGLDGKFEHQLDEGISLSANLGVGYDALDQQTSITAAFAGDPSASAFTTKGLDMDPWLLRGGLGISRTMSSGVEISARYDADRRQNFSNNTAALKVRWAF